MLLKHNENTISDLSAEQIGLLAENGIQELKNNSKLKKVLLISGLDEVYAVKKLHKASVIPLSTFEINTLVTRFSPKRLDANALKDSLLIRTNEWCAEFFGAVSGWKSGSTVFAFRETPSRSITYHKQIGRMTIHLEVVNRSDRLVDIRVCLIDDTHRDTSSFDIALFNGEKCVEALNGTIGETLTLSRINNGEYRLSVSDIRGEISALSIRMD